MENKLFALHDSDPKLKKRGAFEICLSEAFDLNIQGFGIFHCVNEFKGARKAENITKINYWFADLDDGTKEEQIERIKNLPIKPTMIVETNAGYHCYWKAKDATVESFKDISMGLIRKLKADPACKDMVRLLRCPHYYHLKNPSKPFKIAVISNNHQEIEEAKMLFAYKIPVVKATIKALDYAGDKEDLLKEENWETIFRISEMGTGGRNNGLARIYLWLNDEGFNSNVIYNTIQRINNKLSEPLPNWEVKAICRIK